MEKRILHLLLSVSEKCFCIKHYKNIIYFAIICSIYSILLCACGEKYYMCTKDSLVDDSSSKDKPVVVNVYLENSGSMDGYINNSDTSLTNDIYEILVNIKNVSKLNLNYINNIIIPQKCELYQYIKDLTPNSFNRAGGNRNNSNIIDCFKRILEKTDSNSVSIFISDFVIAGSDEQGKKAQTRLSEVIGEKLKQDTTFSVVFMQMQGIFNGTCYWGTRNNTILNNELRPYYICIMGSANKIAKILDINKMKNTPNCKKIHSFSNFLAVKYKLLNRQQEVDKIEVNRKNFGYTSSKMIKGKDRKNYTEIKISAYIKQSLLKDVAFIENKNNYEINKKEYMIDTIINKENDNKVEIVVLCRCKDIDISTFTVGIKNPKCSWIDAINTKENEWRKENTMKTFGIKYILDGIQSVYKQDILTEIKIEKRQMKQNKTNKGNNKKNKKLN